MHKPGKSALVDRPFPTPRLTWQGDLLSHAVDRGAMCMSLGELPMGHSGQHRIQTNH